MISTFYTGVLSLSLSFFFASFFFLFLYPCFFSLLFLPPFRWCVRMRRHRLARITAAMEKGNGATLEKEDGVTWERGCIFGKKDWTTAFSRLCRLGVFLGLGAILGFGDMEPDSLFDAWGNRRVPTAGRTGRIEYWFFFFGKKSKKKYKQ